MGEMTFGVALRSARLRKGLKQSVLGRRMGYKDGSMVCLYERGKRKPGEALIRKFAAALGVSAAALMAE